MGKQAIEILDAFEALTPEDKQVVAVEVLRRTRDLPFDSGPLTDEEIGETGRAMLALLDRDEDETRSR
jgi:hypothetical protein